MLDLDNQYLRGIEKFLQVSLDENDILTADDVDPREIVYQAIDQVKQNIYTYNKVQYVPNIVTISFPETKGEKAEDLEMIFASRQFVQLFERFLINAGLRIFNPVRVEVQTVSKGNSRVMYRRAGLALDWPGPEMSTEDTLVTLDYRARQIIEVQVPKPQIAQLAQLEALNAEVYQNGYIVAKAQVHVGRLRNVINQRTGKMIRRNDLAFAHLRDPNAPSNSVSRQHATIQFQAGQFFLFDHGSSNGTAVRRLDGEEIVVTPADTAGVVLGQGDMLRFGFAWVNFQLL
jgi:FHA domain